MNYKLLTDMLRQDETTDGRTIAAHLSRASAQIGRFEAHLLLAHVLGKSREYLIAHDDEELSAETATAFEMIVSLRLAGTPVPYLTGRQEFFGRWFMVDDNVLIPRPDTEVLIEQALLVAGPQPRILDLGTGSGCIAITLALEIPGSSVTATDKSAEALAVCRRNAQTLHADVRLLQGSWFEALPSGETFDLIVSNPPYIHPEDEHLAALEFEPASALTDGIDGLQDLRKIAAGAMSRLNSGGWLLLEHGWDQGAAVRSLLEEAGFAGIHTKKDYGGNERVTMGRRSS